MRSRDSSSSNTARRVNGASTRVVRAGVDRTAERARGTDGLLRAGARERPPVGIAAAAGFAVRSALAPIASRAPRRRLPVCRSGRQSARCKPTRHARCTAQLTVGKRETRDQVVKCHRPVQLSRTRTREVARGHLERTSLPDERCGHARTASEISHIGYGDRRRPPSPAVAEVGQNVTKCGGRWHRSATPRVLAHRATVGPTRARALNPEALQALLVSAS